MQNIDRIFVGGVIIVFIVALAIYALMNSQLGGPGAPQPGGPVVGIPTTPGGGGVTAGGDVCQCYDQAFRLAGSGVEVTSAQYRTGFEQCRAVFGQDGSDAWTAGWNARLSSRPFEATCRNYLRGR
jgi:hypothetical protein